MSENILLKYSIGSLLWDSIKGIFGLILVVSPMIFGEPLPWVTYILIGLSLVFIIFLGRSLLRLLSRYQVTDEGLYLVKPLIKSIQWADLSQFKLRYYSTKKTGDDGWLYLQLKSNGTKMNIDSHLENFEEILKKAKTSAKTNHLHIDPITSENLRAYGLPTED